MLQLHPRPSAKLLIVEDDENVLDLLMTRVQLAGYAPYPARDGVQAMQRLLEVEPEGVILDLNMPRADGFEVLETLSKSPRTSKIPVLVLSVRNRAEDVKAAMSLGARDYLTKPFEDRVLLRRIARLLRKSGDARAADAKPGAPPPDDGNDFLLDDLD